MRRTHVRLVATIAALALLGLGASIAAGKNPGDMPWGKYTGSAASSTGGKAISLTLYVSEGDEGDFELTFNTPAVPIPISVTGVPQQVANGWDVPVSVDYPSVQLVGSGTLRLRQRDGQWFAFGTGSGSFRGKSGSGSASANGVSTASTAGEQVLDALSGFFGGPQETEAPPPAEYVEAEWATPAGEAPAESETATETTGETGSGVGEAEPPATASVADIEEPPLSGGESAGVWFFMFFVFLLFVWL